MVGELVAAQPEDLPLAGLVPQLVALAAPASFPAGRHHSVTRGDRFAQAREPRIIGLPDGLQSPFSSHVLAVARETGSGVPRRDDGLRLEPLQQLVHQLVERREPAGEHEPLPLPTS